MSYVMEVLDTLTDKNLRPYGRHQPSDLELAASWRGGKAMKKWQKKVNKGFDKSLRKAGVHDPDDD